MTGGNQYERAPFPIDDQVEKGTYQRVDIMHYHISGRGHLKDSWSNAHKNYLRILRNPDGVSFITVMREPRSHFLRYLILPTLTLIP